MRMSKEPVQKRIDGRWVQPELTDEEQEWLEEGECPICGADYGPSDSFPWHWPHEDCRAIRKPLNRVEGETV